MNTRTVLASLLALVVLASISEARVLNPSLGRWLSRDPAGYVDGVSLTRYASSAPVLKTDSFGMCCGVAFSVVDTSTDGGNDDCGIELHCRHIDPIITIPWLSPEHQPTQPYSHCYLKNTCNDQVCKAEGTPRSATHCPGQQGDNPLVITTRCGTPAQTGEKDPGSMQPILPSTFPTYNAVWACIQNKMNDLNSRCVPYVPLGNKATNSNTVVAEALRCCLPPGTFTPEEPPVEPGTTAPGWKNTIAGFCIYQD